MNTLLISYDLLGPETAQDYKKIITYIKKAKFWAKPLESLWLIKTNKPASAVRNDLKQITDKNDKILVINIAGDAWATSNMPSKVNEWMKMNI